LPALPEQQHFPRVVGDQGATGLQLGGDDSTQCLRASQGCDDQ
jgi:hypothetical protein